MNTLPPETIKLLQNVLDETWEFLRPEERSRTSKEQIAARFSTRLELGRGTPFACGSQRYMELLRFHSKTFWVTSRIASAIGPLPTFRFALHLSAFGGKGDITLCGSRLLRSLFGVKRTLLLRCVRRASFVQRAEAPRTRHSCGMDL